MAEYAQKTERKEDHTEPVADVDNEVGRAAVAGAQATLENVDDVLAKIDEELPSEAEATHLAEEQARLLAEIDEVLGTDAQAKLFVDGFRQKNGQ